MHYIIDIVKTVEVADIAKYINDCCIGADAVLKWLLPPLRERYNRDFELKQENWGWYIWFEESGVKFGVDVHAIDHERGMFQVHVTASNRDMLELARLQELVISRLWLWPVAYLIANPM